MALLGTWIDKASLQTLGGAAAGVSSFQTVAHFVATIGSGKVASTTPETGIIVVRSVEGLSQTNGPGLLPYWYGANASIATLGLAVLNTFTAGSVPIIAVDCFNTYFHSVIR